MAISLSKTSKLDGILSWSLQAGDTCPGSKNKDGTWVDACSGCYARFGNYVFPNVINVRENNKKDWKRKAWIADMVSALIDEPYFRWFDSGDMYSVALAKKMLQVMKQTPNTKHWLPTRMNKFKKFANIIAEMQALPNVMVRFSSDSILGEFNEQHGSTIVPGYDMVPAGVKVCHAYKHEGKCNGCRSCWDKEVPVIGYPVHGLVAKSKLRIKLEQV